MFLAAPHIATEDIWQFAPDSGDAVIRFEVWNTHPHQRSAPGTLVISTDSEVRLCAPATQPRTGPHSRANAALMYLVSRTSYGNG